MAATSIFLQDHGVRVFSGRLSNHDYVWFSSNEFSKVSLTAPILHNYALSYALSGYSYGLYWGSVPRYVYDLQQMNVYANPAASQSARRTRFTYNAMDDLTMRTDTGGKQNTPDLGYKVCLDPLPAVGPARSEYYKVFAFSVGGMQLPGVIRLGKKGAAVRIDWTEITDAKACYTAEPITPSHPVNPLDITGEVLEYEPVSIPPHLLFRQVKIAGDWYIFNRTEAILFPKSVRTRLAL